MKLLLCVVLVSGLLVLGTDARALTEPKRQLLDGNFKSLADTHDTMRQVAAADSSTRIRAAVASAKMETVSGGASQGMRGLPLRRTLLQLTSSFLNESLRAVQQQNSASASRAMIRGAVDGEMDVDEAIRGAQSNPTSQKTGKFLP